jgi:hypothetical protein
MWLLVRQDNAAFIIDVKKEFVAMASGCTDMSGITTGPYCPWSQHQIAIDDGISFARQESVLSQFSTPFLPGTHCNSMYDFYTTNGNDNGAMVLWFVCKFCMSSLNTGSHKRGSKPGRAKPFMFEKSYMQNIVKHACAGQHQRAILNYYKGYMACMRDMATFPFLSAEASTGDNHHDCPIPTNAYIQLRQYVRWRERLIQAALGPWAEEQTTWTAMEATPETVQVWASLSGSRPVVSPIGRMRPLGSVATPMASHDDASENA